MLNSSTFKLFMHDFIGIILNYNLLQNYFSKGNPDFPPFYLLEQISTML